MSTNLKPLFIDVINTPPLTPNYSQINMGAIAILVVNKSVIDMVYTGFGVNGTDVIPAQTMMILRAYVNNPGFIEFVPQDNLKLINSTPASTGLKPTNQLFPILITEYYFEGEVPIGTFPCSLAETYNPQVTNANISPYYLNALFTGGSPGTNTTDLFPPSLESGLSQVFYLAGFDVYISPLPASGGGSARNLTIQVFNVLSFSASDLQHNYWLNLNNAIVDHVTFNPPLQSKDSANPVQLKAAYDNSIGTAEGSINAYFYIA